MQRLGMNYATLIRQNKRMCHKYMNKLTCYDYEYSADKIRVSHTLTTLYNKFSGIG